MNDPYGNQYPTAQRGQPEDSFRPPYTQDPPYSPNPPYGQPNAFGGPGQGNPAPGVQPVYVPYAVPAPGSAPGDGFALASMILGIIAAALGWTIGLIPCFAVFALGPAIIGIVFGGLGLKSPNRRGMAIAGIILSVLGIAAGTVFIWL